MKWDQIHNRPAPDAGPEHYKTYRWNRPLSTHFRPATCEEFECDDYIHGFVLSVDTSSDLGQRQYEYVSHDKSRRFNIEKVGPCLFKFWYPAGQRGFGEKHKHHVPLGNPAVLLVAEGDFRGNPRKIPVRVHRRVEDWVDDFANHQDKLATIQQRG